MAGAANLKHPGPEVLEVSARNRGVQRLGGLIYVNIHLAALWNRVELLRTCARWSTILFRLSMG